VVGIVVGDTDGLVGSDVGNAVGLLDINDEKPIAQLPEPTLSQFCWIRYFADPSAMFDTPEYDPKFHAH